MDQTFGIMSSDGAAEMAERLLQMTRVDDMERTFSKSSVHGFLDECKGSERLGDVFRSAASLGNLAVWKFLFDHGAIPSKLDFESVATSAPAQFIIDLCASRMLNVSQQKCIMKRVVENGEQCDIVAAVVGHDVRIDWSWNFHPDCLEVVVAAREEAARAWRDKASRCSLNLLEHTMYHCMDASSDRVAEKRFRCISVLLRHGFTCTSNLVKALARPRRIARFFSREYTPKVLRLMQDPRVYLSDLVKDVCRNIAGITEHFPFAFDCLKESINLSDPQVVNASDVQSLLVELVNHKMWYSASELACRPDYWQIARAFERSTSFFLVDSILQCPLEHRIHDISAFARADMFNTRSLRRLASSGVVVSGMARRFLADGVSFVREAPVRNPKLHTVAGVETMLALGHSPKFLLQKAFRTDMCNAGRNLGIQALVAILNLSHHREEKHSKVIWSMCPNISSERAERVRDAVERGILLRKPPGETFPQQLWTSAVIPMIFGLELPTTSPLWTAAHRKRPRGRERSNHHIRN